MQLHGTISNNLRAAIRSAQRLRGHPVYPETLCYWTDLVANARADICDGPPRRVVEIGPLIRSMEAELGRRHERSAARG